MKEIKWVLVLLTITLVGCKRETVDLSCLLAERDSLKEESIRQKQDLDNLNAFIGAVSEGLDSIAMQEQFIKVGNPEGGPLSRAQLKQSLEELGRLLARQRASMDLLEDSLKMKGFANDRLHKIIDYLNDQLEAKEKTINQLRAEVSNKNYDIARLQTQISTLNENVEILDKKNKAQQQALVTQSEMMNECYMKMGTKKQLKQAGILDGKKLNPGSLTPNRFVKVDIRQFREIQINSKKPKILTTMPQNSYRITRNGDGTSTLSISDPTAFWSVSNYLVILLD